MSSGKIKVKKNLTIKNKIDTTTISKVENKFLVTEKESASTAVQRKRKKQ